MSRLPSLGPRGEGWLALQLLLLAAIVAAGVLIAPALGGTARVVAAGAGILLGLAGLALVGLGAGQLGRGASPLPRPPASGELVRHGLYRRVRHPIYVGVVLSALGWALLMASAVALLLVGLLALLLDLKARREETWLRERYPGYADYQRQTNRFIPGLY